MSGLYLHSCIASAQFIAESSERIVNPCIQSMDGKPIACRLLDVSEHDGVVRHVFDASRLATWSPSAPVLYRFCADGGISETFGHCELRTFSNTDVLLNGERCFLRGYIRGIVAHDHPNMTGGTTKDAAVKNIRQAKKYGFNLVRFHSTIPTPEFVEAADEEGMLIHMEIGFAYEYDNQGAKKKLSMDNTAWRETILRFRNHPSAAIFCIGNEMHKSGHQIEVHALYRLGRELAPSKLIMDNSGWGEYDRPTADLYSQHIAYYFPYKHHADMFATNDCWRLNGSTFDQELESEAETPLFHAHIRRETVPLKPVVAHEALHYIDIPDYEALNRKFDAFCERVGAQYLADHGIRKPRYLTELPALIRKKGLEAKLPDYILGSQMFKKMAFKVYLERLRLSGICGFEMLQLSDTLKYENKNGIIDFFDDDKYFSPEWMRTINDDAILLAELERETFYRDEHVRITLSISNFLPQPCRRGTLTVRANGHEVWIGKEIALAGGRQKLAEIELSFPAVGAAEKVELTAEFSMPELTLHNCWNFWIYPRPAAGKVPTLKLADTALEARIRASGGAEDPNLILTDTLTDGMFDSLHEGKTVILIYRRDNPANQYYLPSALERFKPCIWDRGSNLGGIISSEPLRKALASGRYFELNMQPLLEGGFKINLDDFPVPPQEWINGIDKPARDRMKGLIHGIKDFIPEDTLRNFSHLFSLRVGNGLLIVSSFALPENPVVTAYLSTLFRATEYFNTEKKISAEDLKSYLRAATEKGERKEDVMNHFWEIDNKPVEDTLFWEETGIDLSKLH